MITLRRAQERHHQRRRKQETWLTFHAGDDTHPFANGFGALETLQERRLPPQAGHRLPDQDLEIITYVRDGTLAYQDPTGQSGILKAGEFQRMTAGRGVRYSEMNASPTAWAHAFQFRLRPAGAGLEPGHEQKRFSRAERRGVLCVVASPDGRQGSLRVHQDVVLYSAMLYSGQHVIHELSPNRNAWLHIVQGHATLDETTLETGDGAGFTAERAVSLTANEETEILLLELAQLGTSELARGGNGRGEFHGTQGLFSDSSLAGGRCGVA